MRDRETIDCELRLLTAVRRVCREHGTPPSIGPVHELLDERAELTGSSLLGHQPRDRVDASRPRPRPDRPSSIPAAAERL